MATHEVRVTLSRDRVRQFLRHELPAMLSGKMADVYGIARAAQAKLIFVALTDIHDDFTAKSLGGVGEDGTVWEPLHPATIRERSQGGKGVSGQPGGASKVYPAVDHAWLLQTKREIYRREYARLLSGGVESKEAKRQAAIISRFLTKGVWEARQKALGKGTEGQAAVGGPEEFPILDDTGRLKASVAPGSLEGSGLGMAYHPGGMQPGDQVAENTRGGGIKVESNVEYGDPHMRPGKGSKFGGFRPARPWKFPYDVPQAWTDKWAAVYADTVTELIPEVLQLIASE